jgi:DNA adenine methylase
MSDDMPIKALIPWFGAKRNLAPVIVEELGSHRAFWEPFCGSMAVLLAKPACCMETVNDLHGDLINLARVIQNAKVGPAFYRSLRRTLFHEDIHAEARALACSGEPPTDGTMNVARALAFFLMSWMGRELLRLHLVASASGNGRYAARAL